MSLSLPILTSCKASRPDNSCAGKYLLILHCESRSHGIRYYWITTGIFCLFQTRSPSKAAGMFSGTQEKCATCGKTAYPLEKVREINLWWFSDMSLWKLCGYLYVEHSKGRIEYHLASFSGNIYEFWAEFPAWKYMH